MALLQQRAVLRRLFDHPAAHQLARHAARVLSRRRFLAGNEGVGLNLKPNLPCGLLQRSCLSAGMPREHASGQQRAGEQERRLSAPSDVTIEEYSEMG